MGRHDPRRFEFDGMTCAACAGRVERAIMAVAVVDPAHVSRTMHRGQVRQQVGPARMCRVRRVGH